MIVTVLLSLMPAVELFVPVLAIASALPRRSDDILRTVIPIAATGAALAILMVLYYWWVYYLASGTTSYVGMFLLATINLLACIPMVMSAFDASIWKLLFCVGAGYTIQNLASGLSEFVRMVIGRLSGTTLNVWNGLSGTAETTGVVIVISIAADVIVYIICYLLFIKKIYESGFSEVEDRGMLAILLLVMLAVIAFDVAIKSLNDMGADLASLSVLRVTHVSVCTFVLFVQYRMLYSRALEAELAIDRQMSAERERQWQISQEEREAINVKCHDIRHQIRMLAGAATSSVDPDFLEGIAQEVDIYDSLIRTGNDALDTIVSEKALVCDREGITLTCIADGSALDFMSPAEIYSLFGNALDNAMRAVRDLDDPGLRSISVGVRRIGSLVSISIENWCAEAPCFEDGLPKTTQSSPRDHGFGTRSIRSIVERHGGTCTFGIEGAVFSLTAMLPMA